jgi:hypothetical protein
VIVFSSGAAVSPNGSPLSGGCAGAKATQRLMTGYARDEAERAGLDITFTAVMPYFAPVTASARRRSRPTQLAPASPWRSISGSTPRCSPRRSPALLWSSWYGQIPRLSLPGTG